MAVNKYPYVKASRHASKWLDSVEGKREPVLPVRHWNAVRQAYLKGYREALKDVEQEKMKK